MSDLQGDTPAGLGIHDRATGLERARAARKTMTTLASAPLRDGLSLSIPSMTLMSLLTKAQAFHDGAVGALEADNPFATFTLIRAYAENAAALLWIGKRPADIAAFYPETPREGQITVGRLVNGARSRMNGFKPIYDQLSAMAHPSAASALSGWHSSDEVGLGVRWSSVPAFKNDEDCKTACFWLVELGTANGHLWREAWLAVLGLDAPAPSKWGHHNVHLTDGSE